MSYASIACADPSYATALEAYGGKGFTTRDSIVYGGKTYTHADIAEQFDASYRRHRGKFAMLCGGKPRMERKRKRQFENAVRSDMLSSYGVSWWTIIFGGLLLALGGPLGLLIAVIAVLFEHYMEKDLNNDRTMLAVMGVA